MAGIEPASQPWQGCMLPIHYTRSCDWHGLNMRQLDLQSSDLPTDLQSLYNNYLILNYLTVLIRNQYIGSIYPEVTGVSGYCG